jgi:hypothetical protein
VRCLSGLFTYVAAILFMDILKLMQNLWLDFAFMCWFYKCRGKFIVIQNHGEQKPVLGHYFTGVSVYLFGNE